MKAISRLTVWINPPNPFIIVFWAMSTIVAAATVAMGLGLVMASVEKVASAIVLALLLTGVYVSRKFIARWYETLGLGDKMVLTLNAPMTAFPMASATWYFFGF